jgi:hypothetical protein
MQANDPATAPVYQSRNLGVSDVKTLLESREGALANYRMNFGSVDEGWDVPRHRHNFDQIRFPVAGEFEYAPGKVLPAGWVGYFPEGVPYGPQARRPGLVMLLLQFGGATGAGYLSKKIRRKAIDELEKHGSFDMKTLTYTDTATGKRVQEYQAIWKQATATELVYPQPRYTDLVLMNPASSAWVEARDMPGVARKWLGSFTERDVRIGFFRVDAGKTLTIAPSGASQLLFLSTGAVSHQGKAFGIHSAFDCEAGDGPLQLKAERPSELLYMKMPTFA